MRDTNCINGKALDIYEREIAAAKQINAYEFIMKQVTRARGSKGYFPREAFYEAKGMLEMAYSLKAITKEEYFELNTAIVYNGINNPEYFN